MLNGDATISLLQRLLVLVKASDSHTVFAGIADAVSSMLEADAVAIFEGSGANGRLSLATARNLSLGAQVQAMRILAGRIVSDSAELENLQIIDDWPLLLETVEEPVRAELGRFKLMVGLPLRSARGEALGLLGIYFVLAEAFTPRRQLMVMLLGELASVALENARLYELERHRSAVLTDILRSGEQLRVNHTLDAMLKNLVDIVAERLGWQSVVVALHDFETSMTRPVAWVFQEKKYADYMLQMRRLEPVPIDNHRPWRQEVFKISRSYYGSFSEGGEPEIWPVEMILTSPGLWQHGDFVVVPLNFRGLELGWLMVDDPRDEYRPSLVAIQELEVFADQAAQAVINARLYSEVQDERLKLKTVLDGIQDGVLAFDNQGHLLFANGSAERLLGVALLTMMDVHEQVVLAGSPLLSVLQCHDENDVDHDQHVDAHDEHDDAHDDEHVDAHVDEKEDTGRIQGQEEEKEEEAICAEIEMENPKRTLFVTIKPLAEIGRLVTLQDVTYLRDMEQMRQDLLSSLSHDLKSPLSAVDLTAVLIKRAGNLNTQQEEYVERLRTVARRAVAMITDLLEMARLESGIRLEKTACNLPAMLEGIAEDLRLHAEQKSIVLNLEYAQGLPPVEGDEIRLRQALANLVGNAIKYTLSGGEVRVRAVHSNNQLVLTVSDTGIGIPEAHLPHLFDRFYRVDPASDQEGSGMGLAIVKTVINRHGGTVSVASVEGEGSTFEVKLPALTLPETTL